MPILDIKNVTKHFHGISAVNNISLTLEEGEMLGLVGPNGSGKTTLFNLISGFLKITSGTIVFRNEDITKYKTYQRVIKGINRTFQVVRPFSSLTVYENIKVGCLSRIEKNKIIHQKIMSLIESVGLKGLENEESRNLPLGHLKKLEVAKALATKPKLLLLDEPFGGLSHREIAEIIPLVKEINERGVSVIVVEHVMSALVKLVEKVVVLNFGQKIAHGPINEVMTEKTVIDAYLGDDYVENK
jgi:ABC-type branched-subunit amino acid transport system ATPase component